MVEYIYSNKQNGLLLHAINKINNINEKRQDLCPSDEFIQVSCFKLNNGKTFKPHKHIILKKETNITQESWVVISGKVKAILYDIDDTIIKEIVLEQGDCSITFRGGHNYECLEDGTVVYEYKTGPYLGIENDKVFI